MLNWLTRILFPEIVENNRRWEKRKIHIDWWQKHCEDILGELQSARLRADFTEFERISKQLAIARNKWEKEIVRE